MINWNLAKKGATIVLRCGGRIELEKDVDFYDCRYFPYTVKGKGYEESYEDSGLCNWGSECALDIVSIEPAPEPKRTEVFIPFYTKYGLGEINSIKGVAEARINQHGGGCLIRITCTDDPNNPDPTIEVVK